MNATSPLGPHWSETLLVGHSAIDRQHQEFVFLVSELLAGNDDTIFARLEALQAHARAHFREEDALMQNTGFPQRQCHMDEHRAVLSSISDVLEQVRSGKCREGHRLAQALADWLPGHIQHLDSALAAWESTRTAGGKPVVLRRNVQASAPDASAQNSR